MEKVCRGGSRLRGGKCFGGPLMFSLMRERGSKILLRPEAGNEVLRNKKSKKCDGIWLPTESEYQMRLNGKGGQMTKGVGQKMGGGSFFMCGPALSFCNR